MRTDLTPQVVFHPHVDHHTHANFVASLRSVHASDLASAAYGLVGHVRDFAIGKARMFHGHFSETVLEHIRASPDVAFVERDSRVFALDVEKGAPWGLARVSHRSPLSFGTFNKYEYEHVGGTGVDVYVVDTGINIKHVEFEVRRPASVARR